MWDEATNSTAVFRSWIAGVVEPEFIGAWLQPDVRYILTAWTDQVTPDRNASIPASAYGQGEWQAAREVIDTGAGNLWPARGILAPCVGAPSPSSFGLGLNPIARGPISMAGAAGDHLSDRYSRTVNQGVAYHYWGGFQNVINGSMTISWAQNLVLSFTF